MAFGQNVSTLPQCVKNKPYYSTGVKRQDSQRIDNDGDVHCQTSSRAFSELKGSNEKICKDQGDADAFGPVLLGCDELCKGGNSSNRAQKTEDVDDCDVELPSDLNAIIQALLQHA